MSSKSISCNSLKAVSDGCKESYNTCLGTSPYTCEELKRGRHIAWTSGAGEQDCSKYYDKNGNICKTGTKNNEYYSCATSNNKCSNQPAPQSPPKSNTCSLAMNTMDDAAERASLCAKGIIPSFVKAGCTSEQIQTWCGGDQSPKKTPTTTTKPAPQSHGLTCEPGFTLNTDDAELTGALKNSKKTGDGWDTNNPNLCKKNMCYARLNNAGPETRTYGCNVPKGQPTLGTVCPGFCRGNPHPDALGQRYTTNTVEECKNKCIENSKCKGFDYGNDGSKYNCNLKTGTCTGTDLISSASPMEKTFINSSIMCNKYKSHPKGQSSNVSESCCSEYAKKIRYNYQTRSWNDIPTGCVKSTNPGAKDVWFNTNAKPSCIGQGEDCKGKTTTKGTFIVVSDEKANCKKKHRGNKGSDNINIVIANSVGSSDQQPHEYIDPLNYTSNPPGPLNQNPDGGSNNDNTGDQSGDQSGDSGQTAPSQTPPNQTPSEATSSSVVLNPQPESSNTLLYVGIGIFVLLLLLFLIYRFYKRRGLSSQPIAPPITQPIRPM